MHNIISVYLLKPLFEKGDWEMRNKMTKKSIAVILSLVLALAGLPVFGSVEAKAAPAVTFRITTEAGTDLFEFKVLNDSEVSLKQFFGDNLDEGVNELIIPSEVNNPDTGVGYKVTVIDENAFSKQITDEITVTIPDTIKSIGKNAFSYSSGIVDITIPDSVTEIGEYAFYYCDNLKDITLSKKLTSLSRSVFSCCSSLVSINIPDNITKIGINAFYNCTNLKTVIMSDFITDIDKCAFLCCESLSDIYISKNVENIGYAAFAECYDLKGELILPEGLKSIGEHAFVATNYDSIIIPSTVEEFGENCFWSFTPTKQIINNSCIPLNVSYFSDIYSYKNEEGVIISSITKSDGICVRTLDPTKYFIDEYSDLMCEIINEEDLTVRIAGISDSYKENVIIPAFVSNGIKTYNVEEIGKDAFGGAHISGTLTISNGIKKIGDYAFEACTDLIGDLIIPDSVVEIGEAAFFYTGFDGTLKISKNLTEIPYSCFDSIENLKGPLVIPESVVNILDGAFAGCKNLSGNLVIPEGITSIGEYAFTKCEGLNGSLIIPSSLTNLGTDAFENCCFTVIENNSVLNLNEYGLNIPASYPTYLDEDGKVATELGKGNYSLQTLPIDISEYYYADLKDTSIKYIDSGKEDEYKPEIIVYSKDNINNVLPSTCYDVTYSNNTSAGGHILEASYTVTGKDIYTGTIEGQFTILADLNSDVVIIDAIPDQNYSEEAASTPKITVRFANDPTIEYVTNSEPGAFSEYSVSYTNNDKTGEATVTITASGDPRGRLVGETKRTFNILQVDPINIDTITTNMFLCGTDAAYLQEILDGMAVATGAYGKYSLNNPNQELKYGSNEISLTYTPYNTNYKTLNNVIWNITVNHNPTITKTENSIPASCTEDGSYDMVSCCICGEKLSSEHFIDEHTGHVAGTALKENEVEATCTSEGSYDLVTRCSNCNEVLSKETIKTEKLAHTLDTRKTNEADSTCSKVGHYDLETYCTVCGSIISSEQKEIDKKAHTLATKEINKTYSTCNEVGHYDLETYCTVCGTQISIEHKDIAKKAHTPGNWETIKSATATEAGKKVKKCTGCGVVVEEEVIPATGSTSGSGSGSGSSGSGSSGSGSGSGSSGSGSSGSGSGSGSSGSGSSGSGSGSSSSGSGSSGSGSGSGSSGSGSSGTGNIPGGSGSGTGSSGSGSGSSSTGTGTTTGTGTSTSTGTGTTTGTSTTKTIKVGDIITDKSSNAKYKVTAVGSKKNMVEYISYEGSSKTVKVPATITAEGISFKVTTLAASAFKKNKNITKLTLGDNITKISKGSFAYCTALKKVVLGKSITTIGESAFKNCTSLEELTIPEGVKNLRKGIFTGCKSLKKLVVRASQLSDKTVAKGVFKAIPATCKVYTTKAMKSVYSELFAAKGLSSKIKVKATKK